MQGPDSLACQFEPIFQQHRAEEADCGIEGEPGAAGRLRDTADLSSGSHDAILSAELCVVLYPAVIVVALVFFALWLSPNMTRTL